MIQILNRKISDYGKVDMNYAVMRVCLAVLDELGLITYSITDGIIALKLYQIQGKIRLDNSVILSALKQNG